mmetsp:Transcript_130770/g.364435  ORF Transcript_130770/g.364435 Transcript_130770/m.364435 type:complete len:214 (-) Transcript_130770:135-776(-)
MSTLATATLPSLASWCRVDMPVRSSSPNKIGERAQVPWQTARICRIARACRCCSKSYQGFCDVAVDPCASAAKALNLLSLLVRHFASHRSSAAAERGSRPRNSVRVDLASLFARSGVLRRLQGFRRCCPITSSQYGRVHASSRLIMCFRAVIAGGRFMYHPNAASRMAKPLGPLAASAIAVLTFFPFGLQSHCSRFPFTGSSDKVPHALINSC